MPTDCCFVPGESIRFVPPNSRVFREGTENQKRTKERCRPPPHVLPVKASGRWHYSCLCDAAVAPPGTSTLPQDAGCAPWRRDRAKDRGGAGVWRERVARTPARVRNLLPGARNESPVVRRPRCHPPRPPPLPPTPLPPCSPHPSICPS